MTNETTVDAKKVAVKPVSAEASKQKKPATEAPKKEGSQGAGEKVKVVKSVPVSKSKTATTTTPSASKEQGKAVTEQPTTSAASDDSPPWVPPSAIENGDPSAGALIIEDDEESDSVQLENGSTDSEDEASDDDSSDDDDDDDTEEDDDEDTTVIEVFRPECLECKALVPFAEKTRKSCHFTAGNDNCPAKSMQIVLRIPVEEIMKVYRRAKRAADEGNTMPMATFYSGLSKKKAWQQKVVQDAIQDEERRVAQEQLLREVQRQVK